MLGRRCKVLETAGRGFEPLIGFSGQQLFSGWPVRSGAGRKSEVPHVPGQSSFPLAAFAPLAGFSLSGNNGYHRGFRRLRLSAASSWSFFSKTQRAYLFLILFGIFSQFTLDFSGPGRNLGLMPGESSDEKSSSWLTGHFYYNN